MGGLGCSDSYISYFRLVSLEEARKGYEQGEHPGDGPEPGSGLGTHAAQAESVPREEAMAAGIASMVSIAASTGNGS